MKSLAVPIRMIVGLGNPGSQYEHTRHNAGQQLVEKLADSNSCTLSSTPKFFGLSSLAAIGEQPIRLLVPTTFMNKSGQAVATLSQFYKIPPEAILVIHDELDLQPGIARLKMGGGHGGHNGLRDIITSLGNNNNFARLRIGIGHPGHASAVANYVLKRASPSEQQCIDDAIHNAISVIGDLIKGDWDKACRELHSTKSNSN